MSMSRSEKFKNKVIAVLQIAVREEKSLCPEAEHCTNFSYAYLPCTKHQDGNRCSELEEKRKNDKRNTHDNCLST